MLLSLSIFSKYSSAQLTPEQRIPDSVIGWWDNKRFDSEIKPTKDPVQKKRIQIDDSLVSWMMKSYVPVGGLGTYTRQNYPGWYGARFAVWNVSHDKMWTDQQGHFNPIAEEATPFAMQVNTLPATQVFDFLNAKNDFYFTWQPDGYMSEEEAKRRKGYPFKDHPNFSRFITRITNRQNCIILAPGNQPPFVEVSIGEFLDRAEASIEPEKLKEKERVRAQWPGSDAGSLKAREEANAYKATQFEAVLNRIRKWRQVYKDRLNETATFNASHQTLLSAFNADEPDPFAVSPLERSRKEYYIVYKVPPRTVELCRTEKPQWITVWYPFENKQDGNQLYEMSTALTENLNYTYIYDYFFDPEKVKGKAYTPANAEQLAARLDGYRKKNKTNNNPAADTHKWDAQTHFQDDFSSSAAGNDPANWFFSKTGNHCSIAQVKGHPGNWLQLGYNNETVPVLLKKPFPADFTLEFDLLTDAFSGRTGGAVQLRLSTWKPDAEGILKWNGSGNGANLNIRLTSGNENDLHNNNYSGEAKLELRKTPEVNEENNSGGAFATYDFREFTDKKDLVHISLRVNKGAIQLLVNNNEIISAKDMKKAYGGDCSNCNIPGDLSFNYLSWKSTTDNASGANVYISNIRITKN